MNDVYKNHGNHVWCLELSCILQYDHKEVSVRFTVHYRTINHFISLGEMQRFTV